MAGFVDEVAFFGVPSTKRGCFVDEKPFFEVPSTKRAGFVDSGGGFARCVGLGWHRGRQVHQPAAQNRLRELDVRARSACFVPEYLEDGVRLMKKRKVLGSAAKLCDLRLFFVAFLVFLFV